MKLLKKLTTLFAKKEQMFDNKEKIEEVKIKRELRIAEEDGKTNVYFGNDLIISNSAHRPFVEVLRGEFAIKDGKVTKQFRKIIPIVNVKAEKVRNFVKMEFADKGYRVSIQIKELNNKIEISLDGKENYEYINLNFNTSHDEKFCGLGENEYEELKNCNILNYPNIAAKSYLDVFSARNKDSKKTMNTSGVILSDKNYLIYVDSKFPTEYKINNKITISFNKRPKKIEFYFGETRESLYFALEEGTHNHQKLLTRYIKGIILEETVKKVEKTLTKAIAKGVEINSIVVEGLELGENLDTTALKEIKEITDSKNVNLIIKISPELDEKNIANIEKFKEKIEIYNNFANGYYLSLKEVPLNSVAEIEEIHTILAEKTTKVANKILLSDCNVFNETLEYIVVNNTSNKISENWINSLVSNSLSGFGLICPIITKSTNLLVSDKDRNIAETAILFPIAIYADVALLLKDVAKTKQLIAQKEALRPYYIKAVNGINKGALCYLSSKQLGGDAKDKIYIANILEIDTTNQALRINRDGVWAEFEEPKQVTATETEPS